MYAWGREIFRLHIGLKLVSDNLSISIETNFTSLTTTRSAKKSNILGWFQYVIANKRNTVFHVKYIFFPGKRC